MHRKNPKKINIASILLLIAYLFLLSLNIFHRHEISISFSNRIDIHSSSESNDAFLDNNFICKVAQTFSSQLIFSSGESRFNIDPENSQRISILVSHDLIKSPAFNSDILRGPPLA